MSPRLSGGFLNEWQNLPRWMIGFGLDRFDRASRCIRDLRVSKLASVVHRAKQWPDRLVHWFTTISVRGGYDPNPLFSQLFGNKAALYCHEDFLSSRKRVANEPLAVHGRPRWNKKLHLFLLRN